MTDVETLYKEFDNYDFGTDEMFISGLKSIFPISDEENIDAFLKNIESNETFLKAKLFYFSKLKKTPIDENKYKEYKSKNTASENDKTETPPYPASFDAIAQMILEGKPIPGIREIPNVNLGDTAASDSVESQRKKPWE